MTNPLDEACAILDDFEKEITLVGAIWKAAETDSSHLSVLEEYRQRKYYRMWLHGATTPDECNELDKRLYDDLPATETANSSAQDVHQKWRDWLKSGGQKKKWSTSYAYDKKSSKYQVVRSEEPDETYYANDDRFVIQEPQDNETLLQFIMRLAQSVKEAGERHRLQERALGSFLYFIRKNYPTDQVAFIEQILPKRRDLHYGNIRRLILPEAYPIPERVAAEILIKLADRCRTGRPDNRHTAVEGIALCWLCIASSRIRLPKTFEMVRKIQATAVLSGAEFSISQVPTFGSGCTTYRPLLDDEFSVLQVPTWFGGLPLKISNRIAAFLRAVSRIPSKKPRETILQRSRRGLEKIFDEVLQSISLPSEYGNITYLSLLNQPHIFGDHRPQLKQ